MTQGPSPVADTIWVYDRTLDQSGITLFKGSLSHFEVRASFRDQRYLGVVKTARNSLALMSRMEVRSEDISYVNDSVSIGTFRKLR